MKLSAEIWRPFHEKITVMYMKALVNMFGTAVALEDILAKNIRRYEKIKNCLHCCTNLCFYNKTPRINDWKQNNCVDMKTVAFAIEKS